MAEGRSEKVPSALPLMARMDPQIVPEPSAEEREALDRALARLLVETPDQYSAWWRAGIRETLNPEEEPG